MANNTIILVLLGDIIVDKKYTLYLDETFIELNNQGGDFSICGIIVKDDYHDKYLLSKINDLKYKIWNQEESKIVDTYVLPELESTKARKGNINRLKKEYNKIFRNKGKYNLLYDSMNDIILTSDITILGCCIKEYDLCQLYNHSINDRMSIAINILVENFYHFLITNNAIGTICYEEMPENQNEIIKRRYNQIRSSGTMFYSPQNINKKVKGLIFKNKYDCIPGLQIADFIPNSVVRNIRGITYQDGGRLRSVDINIIKNKTYDGNCNKLDRFGIKIIP